ncbi:MAG: DUF3299 domain-containing protein [Pseudomonadota bacterium]
MIRITRRSLALGGTLALAASVVRGASDPLALEWEDLIPVDARATMFEQLVRDFGLSGEGSLASAFAPQDRRVALTTEYNGRYVSLPGYMVPLAFDGTMVREMLLVPYVGACIHVPPPPPNQIVMVNASEPYETTGYFEAIMVTGKITTMAVETELAEIGYVMTDATIEPYDAW